jgi:hypothetical protein
VATEWCSPSVSSATRATWEQQRDADVRHLEQARQWRDYLEQDAESLGRRLVSFTNLVAATTTGLATDERFGNRAAPAIVFDRMMIEEAETLTRSELVTFSRHASHCVLVAGCDVSVDSAPPETNGKEAVTIPQPTLFVSLWRLLNPEPRVRSDAWFIEKDRIGCRLRTVPPELRSKIERERLVDRPEIELRILTLPNADPSVVEITFPATMSVAQAKEFLFRELDELAVAAGSAHHWCESDSGIRLSFAERGERSVRADLGHGVSEILCRPVKSNGDGHPTSPWLTCHFEFDRAAGWTQTRAADWAQRHLGIRDLRRTIRLDVPHRMAPPLAEAVSQLLFAGGYRIPKAERNGTHAAIEFVSALRPVNGTDTNGRNHRRKPERLPAFPKEGAGLELDLADRRHLDRLPTEMRSVLPDAGLVNYFEAQAIVRTLEKLAGSEKSLQSVVVIALYPAQALLIRHLVEKSPSLQGSSVEIATPEAFRQREASTVLLGLTRSPAHRAVSFGDGPRALALALTRARSRLFVFGDPGTLVRRTQWNGPVDHLDQTDAGVERSIIARLLKLVDDKNGSVPLQEVRSGGRV